MGEDTKKEEADGTVAEKVEEDTKEKGTEVDTDFSAERTVGEKTKGERVEVGTVSEKVEEEADVDTKNPAEAEAAMNMDFSAGEEEERTDMKMTILLSPDNPDSA